MNPDKIPHIDIENFDSKQFHDCEYVLTSPLSLQACRNLNIKPADLLPAADLLSLKPLDRDKLEKQRKHRIRQTKIERQRLKDEAAQTSHDLTVEGRQVSRGQTVLLDNNSHMGDSMSSIMTSKSRLNRISVTDDCKPNSLVRELQFHQKRQALEQMAKEELSQRKSQLDMRMSRAERNKHEIERKRYTEIEKKRRTSEKKALNVSHRRKQLEEEISIYYRELERFQNMTLKKAEEKAAQKFVNEQAKIQYERQYKELINRHNRILIEEEEANKNQEIMVRIEDKNRHNEQFMQEKLNKIIESRCYAHEAQKVREEIRKIYNLDSFDKKANYAEIVNQVIK